MTKIFSLNVLFFLSFVLFHFTSFAVQKKNILIYYDDGVCRESFDQIKLTLEELTGNIFVYKDISSYEVIHKPWEKNTSLIIFPGGRDKPYQKKLSLEGNKKIKDFVLNGGAYLGICAGSYYAADKIEFDLNNPLYRVNEFRDLKFFPGIARGPFYPGFKYHSSSGVRSVPIFLNPMIPSQNYAFHVYYNGGGYFVDAITKRNVKVLATYDQQKKFPAIVEGKIGKGLAILSAVHLEYNPYKAKSRDQHLKKIYTSLKSHDIARRKFFRFLLSRFRI